MQIRKPWLLVLLILVVACAQIKSFTLPKGITYLKGIDFKGLRSPVWSPDGKKIAASYVIQPMPDVPLISKPRHDVVLIDTETWKSSILESEDGGILDAQVWSSDSNRFALNWYYLLDMCNVYTLELNDPHPICFYHGKSGVVSPDFEKVASFDDYSTTHALSVTNIKTGEIHTFQMPNLGDWSISSWSPDMKRISLIYEKNQYTDPSNIFLLTLSSGDMEQITNDDYHNGPVIFSPDGNFIAYGKWTYASDTGINTKWTISKLDHSCEWTIPIKNDINYLTWSPDGNKLFLVGSGYGAFLADLKVLFGSDFPDGCSKGQ